MLTEERTEASQLLSGTSSDKDIDSETQTISEPADWTVDVSNRV